MFAACLPLERNLRRLRGRVERGLSLLRAGARDGLELSTIFDDGVVLDSENRSGSEKLKQPLHGLPSPLGDAGSNR
jgi:hypothetical protein